MKGGSKSWITVVSVAATAGQIIVPCAPTRVNETVAQAAPRSLQYRWPDPASVMNHIYTGLKVGLT